MTSTTTSALLAVPPELRNSIYRFALLNGDAAIRIKKKAFRDPGLLYVCKQVRDEALPIYYSENTFTYAIKNFDTTIDVLWTRKMRRLRGVYKLHVKAEGEVEEGPNWINLMLWLQQYHAGVVRANMSSRCTAAHYATTGASREELILTNMFDTAREFRDLPWARVERVLAGSRRLLVREDGEWKVDKVKESLV